jgi:hypothetical protein
MSYEPKADQTDGERIASIETLVGDMHTRLFGNGQPGELEGIRGRLTKLESWFWRAAGAGAVVMFLLERYKG